MEEHASSPSTGPGSQQSSPLLPKSSHGFEHESDIESCATTVPETVMAEQVTNDAVKEAQSVGRLAPIDDSASATNTSAATGELPSGPTTADNDSLEAHQTLANASTNGADTASNANAHVSEPADGDATTKQPDASPHETAQPLLNGDSSDHSANESQAVADASGGSDSDISRPGSVDQSKRDIGHVRTNSLVKRPSAFKSVSVTKNFLAKSSASTPVARPGDKAAPVAQSGVSTILTAKPRLVAKLGTGTTPRTLGKVNGAGSGPDASKVWNKNQPVPIPPPRQFTDEELKQRYGIHLATRLQADEAGKEAKWADIDDDEDDWAPDTVQWMDGTKSSVAVVENQIPPVEEPKTILNPEASIETVKIVPATTTHAPNTPNTPKPSVTGGPKTILKPGAHAQPATKSSLVLKGQPEKPTLVAKPSATEKKSPWATLPPVEKASPLQINALPQQPPPQRFSQRESYGYETMPPLPAKEIAPDDFDRSWRGDRGGRELYNSQNDRYEPVNGVRRGSVRDAGLRQQPSVLQRPVQDGPAEPSAAFQTSRASADMPTWGRRRNSSNVSGSNPRRMSFDRRVDMPTGPMSAERRESHSVNGVDHSDTGAHRQSPFVQAVSPSAAQAHPASPYGSVASSGPQDLPASISAPAPAPAPPVEDPVEVQKRLMADKIERARLKKQQEQEAEQKEQAERKERIAKKLAALGPPAESKSKIKEQSPARAPEKSPRKDKAVPASTQSPPKPPVPTADGEVAQYGMMKVHQPHPVKKPSSTDTSPAAKSSKPVESAADPSSVNPQAENQALVQPVLTQQSAQPLNTFPRESEKPRQSGEQSKGSGHQSASAIPAGPNSQAPQAAWPTAAPQPRPWTSQVWGAPTTRERALGNGTFDSGYNRGQSRPGSQQQLPAHSSTSTAPIGLSQAPQLPPVQPVSQLPPSQPAANQIGPMPVQVVAQAQPITRPGPIAPPAALGWGNHLAHIRQDDANIAAKARLDRERQGDTFRPELRETYKDQSGQAQTTLHTTIAGNKVLPDSNGNKDDVVKPLLDGPSPQQNLSQGTPLQQGTGTRASRFFPRPAETAAQATTTVASKGDSPPPPPETDTHPAFASDTDHPLVRLPRPSPVVRLPPSATGHSTAAEALVSMPLGGQSLGARPLARNPEWQARFNKLLEKPGSASTASSSHAPPSTLSTVIPKQGSLAPAALSKASLDVRQGAGPATVSLPAAVQARIFTDDRGKDVITRKDTEALFEDREFGSLPTVKLPKAPHLAAREPATSPPKDEQILRFKKFENPFTTRRLESFDIERLAVKIDVVIWIPGMREAITTQMNRKRRGPKPNGTYKSKPSNAPAGSSASGPKDRPRKPSQQGQGDHITVSSRPAGANAWASNSRPIPPHQQTTWARRAAASAH